MPKTRGILAFFCGTQQNDVLLSACDRKSDNVSAIALRQPLAKSNLLYNIPVFMRGGIAGGADIARHRTRDVAKPDLNCSPDATVGILLHGINYC